MSDLEKDLRQAIISGQDKYTHFLLATAAAAIAFSVQQTANLSVRWSQLPLAFAVGLWGASFYFGCKRLEAIIGITAMTLDMRLQRIMRGREDSEEERDKQRKIFATEGAIASKLWVRQFSFLTAGGICFVAWHVGEMILRTGS